MRVSNLHNPAQSGALSKRSNTAVKPQSAPAQEKKIAAADTYRHNSSDANWRKVYQETTRSAHAHQSKVQAISVYEDHAQTDPERKARFIDTYA